MNVPLRPRWPVALCALGLLAAAAPALAGRSCEPQRLSVDSMRRGLELAERTRVALDASGAEVVVLARVGQDLQKYGLRYSHLGLAYRDHDARGGAAWRVLHKLNQCGTAVASLYRQGLGEFFLDDLWRFEAAWVVPNAALQASLAGLLRDDDRLALMHHRPYSLVSHAWSRRYQQSNQWALETLAAAHGGADTRQAAQAWLQQAGYQPTTLRLGTLSRLGGRISAANITFDDHPPERRFAGRIDTITVDSVFVWLSRSGLGAAPVVLEQH
jgi:hypothetical protein